MRWHDEPKGHVDRVSELREQLERDPYLILGIAESATDEEVKTAYRRYISTYHPDKQSDFMRPHAQEVTKIVNAAYAQICERRGL